MIEFCPVEEDSELIPIHLNVHRRLKMADHVCDDTPTNSGNSEMSDFHPVLPSSQV